MANKTIFRSAAGKIPPKADTRNEAGGKAYSRDAKLALIQYAMVGVFNNTYYTTAEEHTDTLIKLCDGVDPLFIAKLAIYSRTNGLMKDMPAALLAYLTAKKPILLGMAFSRVIDSPRMLRTYVQMVRSGVFGRKSFGSAPRRLIRRWLQGRTPEQLFFANVGNSPSIVDIIKMAHPDEFSQDQSDVVRYLLGKPVVLGLRFPQVILDFEKYKKEPNDTPPAVPFELLTGLPLTDGAWATIAKNASWTQTRMNLNTFKRHNVLGNPEMVTLLAHRLRDREALIRAKAMPYQLFNAWLNTTGQIPNELTEALEEAAEASVENVPAIEGRVLVAIDTSGSMSSAITGSRGSATSKMRCVDVAGLIAAAIKRKNPTAQLVGFDTRLFGIGDEAIVGKTTMDLARMLAAFGGGGTNCALPLEYWNQEKTAGDLVIYVSDNQSWVDSDNRYNQSTGVMAAWEVFKARNPQARMVCIDLTPDTSTQAPNRADILNCGGMSDQVFDVLALFASGKLDGESLAKVIEGV